MTQPIGVVFAGRQGKGNPDSLENQGELRSDEQIPATLKVALQILIALS
jgi:hypothetical protein